MKKFKCRECGKCCYRESVGKDRVYIRTPVYLTAIDLYNMSKYLNIQCIDFLKIFCENNENDFYLKSLGGEGACIFLDIDKNKCKIYEQRPYVCKLFPYNNISSCRKYNNKIFSSIPKPLKDDLRNEWKSLYVSVNIPYNFAFELLTSLDISKELTPQIEEQIKFLKLF